LGKKKKEQPRFEYFGGGKNRIINPDLLGPGVRRSECIVGEKMPDGKWHGPHPFGSGTIVADTPIELRSGQEAEMERCCRDPHYCG
jgi:hypothetical protein